MADYSQLMNLEKKKPLSPSPPRKDAIPTTEQQFASKPANQQESKTVKPQASKPASNQPDLPANQQTSKQLKKFTSYLREDSLKSLKRIAFETEQKDYEVLQEAIDCYLEGKK